MKATRCLPMLSLLLPMLGCPSDAGSDDAGTTTGSTGGTPAESTGAPATTGTTEPGTTTDDPTTGTTAPADESGESTTVAAESTSTAADESSSSDSGSSSTGGVEAIADLDMSVVVEQTAASVVIQNGNFDAESCPVLDGCLGGIGQRRLLRFDTITPNLGDADFFVGNPTDNPELFELSECSGTWLFANYARYRLLDGDGVEVGTGHKSAFALIDLAPWTDDAGPPQYGFGADMGISVGWADIYDAGLDCQWVDITDVPAGDYTLELHINPDEVIAEASFDNNLLQIPVTIPE
jgi:hypothetical protein